MLSLSTYMLLPPVGRTTLWLLTHGLRIGKPAPRQATRSTSPQGVVRRHTRVPPQRRAPSVATERRKHPDVRRPNKVYPQPSRPRSGLALYSVLWLLLGFFRAKPKAGCPQEQAPGSTSRLPPPSHERPPRRRVAEPRVSTLTRIAAVRTDGNPTLEGWMTGLDYADFASAIWSATCPKPRP